MSGRSLAGKTIDERRRFGEWIRPVSERATQEISEEERRYENGTDPKLLDIVQIPLVEPRQRAPQSENHLIDSRSRWTLKGSVDWETIQSAIDPVDSLWMTGSHGPNGLNDRVPEANAERVRGSLLLIKPKKLVIRVGVEFWERKARAEFQYGQLLYGIAITDSAAEAHYLAKDNGQYPVSNALLCISLDEAYQGYCAKTVSGVIVPGQMP